MNITSPNATTHETEHNHGEDRSWQRNITTFNGTTTTYRTGQGDSDGNEPPIAAIAAGVTVPVVLIVLIAGVVYWYYRKKYPVRMIVGRDFAKFSNPAYSRRRGSHPHTLVREDAESFFQQTQPSSPVTFGLGDNDQEANACYVNIAFQYDSHDADEEEVERRFRQHKAYLFKKHEDQEAETKENAEEGKKTDVRKAKTKEKSKVNGQAGRGRGHDNPAFSSDYDAEDDNAEDGGETNLHNDETDSANASSDVPGALEQGDEEAGLEDSSAHETADTLPLIMSDTDQQDGMTVRDFLRQVKEKRAMSDVRKARADSVTTVFEFDVKKSARRRAQSAGDIWTSAAQALPLVAKEDLVLNRSASRPPDDNTEVPDNLNVVHGTYENLTFLPSNRKSSENVRDIPPSEPPADVKSEEEERLITESSYFVVDGTSGHDSNETLPTAKEDNNNAERNRTDSSTSGSSYENVASLQVSDDQSPTHLDDSVSAQPQQSEGAHLHVVQEPAVIAASPETAALQENEYVNIDSVCMMSSSLATSPEPSSVTKLSDSGISQSVESHEGGTNESSEIYVNLNELQTTTGGAEASGSLAIPVSSTADSVMTQSVTLSFDTLEDFPLVRQTSGSSPDEVENVSPSSSLVMLDRNDIEDADTKHDESDDGGFKAAGASPPVDKLSLEDDHFDRVSHDPRAKDREQDEGVLDRSSPHQHSTTAARPGPGSPQELPSLTDADHSRLMSDDGDGPKIEESVDPSPRNDSPRTDVVHGTSDDEEEESTSSQQTSTTDSKLPSDTGQTSQLSSHSGRESSASSSVRETIQSPLQPSDPPGQAAVGQDPSSQRPSDSDSEGLQLTDEDIKDVLGDSDDSSEEHQGPQSHQTTGTSKTPVKIKPTEKFVFSEEEDEDIDV